MSDTEADVTPVPRGALDLDALARKATPQRPFRVRLAGVDHEVPWPLASTRRAAGEAMSQGRVNDVTALLFGGLWPAIDEALDGLEAVNPGASDEAQNELMASALEHFKMDDDAGRQFLSNRRARRDARRAGRND